MLTQLVTSRHSIYVHLIVTLYKLNLHVLYANNISIKLSGEKERNSRYRNFGEEEQYLVNLRDRKNFGVADIVREAPR